LQDIDIEIRPREFVSVVGPSGCGKSTLLKLVAGLENISSGRIEIARRPSTVRRTGSAWCSSATCCWTGAHSRQRAAVDRIHRKAAPRRARARMALLHRFGSAVSASLSVGALRRMRQRASICAVARRSRTLADG